MVHWATYAFAAVLLAPPELQFNLGSYVLSPQRLGALVGLLVGAMVLVQNYRNVDWLCDGLILLHVAWATAALALAQGADTAIQPAGAYTIELLGSYVLGRVVVRHCSDYVIVARAMTLVIMVLCPFAIIETLTGVHILREAAGMLLGRASMDVFERRMGLYRAFGPFQHPIIYGVFCAAGIGMGYYTCASPREAWWRRTRRVCIVVLAVMASMSTGPLLACTTQFGLIAWDRFTRGIRGRWWVLAALFGSAYIAVDTLSNRDPITVFISYATLNPQTGYDRQLIWDFGSSEVSRHPLFGIGLNDWVRPDWMHSSSVDNFWLLTAMRYGLPSVGTLVAVAVTAAWRLSHHELARIHRFRMGWLVSFAGLSLAAFTVHLWGSAFLLFAFLLGVGVSLSRVPMAASLRLPRREAPGGGDSP